MTDVDITFEGDIPRTQLTSSTLRTGAARCCTCATTATTGSCSLSEREEAEVSSTDEIDGRLASYSDG
jgi:hypothetical protein